MNSSFEVSTDQRQLFLDDAGIAEVRNLTRTLHQPQKRGAVVRSSKPHQTISTPVWDPDEKLFKFWVIGTDESYRISLDAEGGELSVEILSLNGVPLTTSTNIRGNHTAIQIQWKEGKLAELLGQKVYLHINLRQTQLYSYWFD